MQIDAKIVCQFPSLKLADCSEILESDSKASTTKNGLKKYKLTFACPMYISKTDKILSPDECQNFIGAMWTSKIDQEFLQKHRDMLKPNNVFNVTAALDSYSMESKHGVWFKIIKLQLANNPPHG